MSVFLCFFAFSGPKSGRLPPTRANLGGTSATRPARYAQRAVTTAGFVWDVGETEAQVVRRFAGGRDVVISVFAVAKGNQAPPLGMIASPVVEKHGSVQGVAV